MVHSKDNAAGAADHMDTDRFSTIIKKYGNAVYGTAYHMLHDFHLAQDIAQEVFIRAYLKLDCSREDASIGSWLYTTTRKLCIDWLRKRRPIYGLFNDESGLSMDIAAIDESIEQLDTRSEIQQALDLLPEDSRLAITLFYIGGYTAKDLSKFLNVSVQAVESRLHRAREKFKKEMMGMVEEGFKENKLDENWEKSIEQAMHKIDYLWKTGNFPEALSEGRKAFSEIPDNIDLKQTLASLLFENAKNSNDARLYDEALHLYESIPDRDPRAYTRTAEIYERKGELQKALEIYKKLSSEYCLESAVSHSSISLGRVWRKLGNNEEAAGILQSSVHFYYFKLLLALRELIAIAETKNDEKMQYDYWNIMLNTINSIGGDNIHNILNYSSYEKFAKFQLRSGDPGGALRSLYQSYNMLLKIAQKEKSYLFDKAPYMSWPGEYDENYELWITRKAIDHLNTLLKRLESKKFAEYRDNPEYVELVNLVNNKIELYSEKYDKLKSKLNKTAEL